MLKKKERQSRTQFNDVFAKGKRYHSPSLQLIAAKSDAFHGSVVISKKVFKKAVARNKLRRQLYALLYAFNKENHAKCAYIVIAKPPIVQKLHPEFASELKTLLKETL